VFSSSNSVLRLTLIASIRAAMNSSKFQYSLQYKVKGSLDETALAVVTRIALMTELSDESGKIEQQFAGVGL
jgi:hypothetical protein